MNKKVALALVIAAWKMRMYFQNYRIIVKTDYPITKILAKLGLAGRMIEWVVELFKFKIQ